MRHALFILITLTLLTPLSGCSAEDRKSATDKEANRQVERIKAPIDKAKKAAELLERHNQQKLPD